MSDARWDWQLGGGHVPNQRKVRGVPGTWLKGRNAWPLGDGNVQAWHGMLATAIAGADNAMLIEDDDAGIGLGEGGSYGTVFGFRGGTVVFNGYGKVIRHGAQIGVAVTSVQILKDGLSYLLGISPPPAVTLPAPTVVGTLEGYISLVLTYMRSATAEESNGSDPSNSIYYGLQKASIPLPGAPAGTVGNATTPATANAGVDRVRVYASLPGYSRIGPWLWTGVESSALGTTIVEEWSPGKQAALGRLAPITFNVPPVGTHSATLAGIIIVVGCYGEGGGAGGFGLAPSLQATLGWDASQVIFLKPGAPVTAVKGDSLEGYILISTADSFHGCLYAPSAVGPIYSRCISRNIGFANNNTWTTVGREIWGVSTDGMFVRSRAGEDFESTFAWPIIPDILGLPAADWVVGYDDHTDKVIYANGTVAWAYDRSAPGDVWSNALDLPAAAVSSVTANGRCYFTLGPGGSQKLYQFNAGNGGYSFAQIVPVFQDAGRGNGAVTEFAVDGECPVKCRILTDLNLDPADDSYAAFDADPNTIDFGGAGPEMGYPAQVHVPGHAWTPELRWQTPGGILYGVEARGYASEEWQR